MKTHRVVGTTAASIKRAENDLNLTFPPSFRMWLLENNGLNINAVTVFPVFDSRDPRKTSHSIVREYNTNWLDWLKTVSLHPTRFRDLLPFGSFGTGDYYCFDYSRKRRDGEVPVVLWNHETGELEDRAESFAEFVERLIQGEFCD